MKKSDDLQQLLQLLQLASVAAEPELKQQQLDDSRQNQNLQVALSLMGMQNASEQQKAQMDLALKQMEQQKGLAGDANVLAREQMLQQKGLAGDSNAIARAQLEQSGRLAGDELGLRRDDLALKKKQMEDDAAREWAKVGTQQAANVLAGQQNEIAKSTHEDATSAQLFAHIMGSQMSESEKLAMLNHLGPRYAAMGEAQHQAGVDSKFREALGAFTPNSSHDQILQQIAQFNNVPEVQQKLRDHWGSNGPLPQPAAGKKEDKASLGAARPG